MNVNEKLEQCEKSYYSFICGHAQSQGGEVYLYDESRSFTFKQGRQAVETLACALADAGVKKGGFVAVRAVRSLDIALIFPALAIIGAAAVMTDAHFKAEEFIASCGVDIKPDYYLTNEDYDFDLSASGHWLLKAADGGAVVPVEVGALKEGFQTRAKEMDEKNSVRELSMIIFTSGSTGKSKAVMLCQRNYIANSVDGGDMFEEKLGDKAMMVLPLHHIFGLALIVCSTVRGHALFFPAAADTEYAARCIQTHKITVLYAVPTYFLSMIADGLHKKYDLSSIRFGLVAGGPSTTNQMLLIEREVGCRLLPVLGMSEYVGVTSYPYDSPSDLRCAGVGTFYPLNEGFILDADGNEVKRGEEGEICVRGPELFLGYYKNKEETDNAIDEKGILHTGDLGYMDENGIVHISGRKKDVIIRGGENISAAKIERALLECKGVAAAAAVGRKDEFYGEVPVAAVTAEKGAVIDESGLKLQLEGVLSKHEIPVYIAVMESFPKTSTEKTDKQKLKELLA